MGADLDKAGLMRSAIGSKGKRCLRIGTGAGGFAQTPRHDDVIAGLALPGPLIKYQRISPPVSRHLKSELCAACIVVSSTRSIIADCIPRDLPRLQRIQWVLVNLLRGYRSSIKRHPLIE